MAGLNAAVVLPGKKRRAAFGDLTNNDDLEVGNKKKKCLKRDNQHCATKKVVRLKQAANKNVVQKPIVSNVVIPSVFDCESLSSATTVTTDDTVAPSAVVLFNASQVLLEVSPKKTSDRLEWIDVDEENKDYHVYVSEYVNDIFQYYKQREFVFRVGDYMPTQPDLSCVKRAILVDWLVDVQQNFELTHETLYLTVKMIDLFLDRHPAVERDRIQLVGTAALSVACKFEEQSAPVITDYVYICDDAYTAEEILAMEVVVLTTLGFDVGMPLSYTFLRRYAQCARVSIPTLTLARFILESSLLDYAYITYSESLIASACLLLAMRIIKEGSWDETVVHYTGYVSADLENLARQLNATVSKPVNKTLETIHRKYSHSVFHEVAKIPALTEVKLTDLFTCAH